ncbi:MAG: hypothetical protein ABGY24_06925 [bacterium]
MSAADAKRQKTDAEKEAFLKVRARERQMTTTPSHTRRPDHSLWHPPGLRHPP